ncbi:MAG: hypothetical protein BKP49_05250 [Treponema sp. CETP13]|nr:MAG: hypothetical protein BKP49_05250 [Treponema sp. CETP13]
MGGPLSLEKHRLLIHWAVNCVKHGIEIANVKDIDKRAFIALDIAMSCFCNSRMGAAKTRAIRAQ